MGQLFSKLNIWKNQSIPLQTHHCNISSENNNQTQELTPQSSIDILPEDILLLIMKNAPQLGFTRRDLYNKLPKIDTTKYPNLSLPSIHSNPRNLIEIPNGKYTFLYDSNILPSSHKWDGLNPSLHGNSIFRPLCECQCDFCKKTDPRMTFQGSEMYGGLFVCPKCQPGLTTRLKQIFGEALLDLIDTNQILMVQCKNGSNKQLIVCSRLPEIGSDGKWHVRTQTRKTEIRISVAALKKSTTPKTD
jgi:hypothetical protein